MDAKENMLAPISRNLTLGYRVYERRHKVILKYLEKNYTHILDLSSTKISGTISPDAPFGFVGGRE